MTESPSESLNSVFDHNIHKDYHHHRVPQIPIEIVSDEEMALLETALVSARSSFSAINSIRASRVRSIQSITIISKRRFSGSLLLELSRRRLSSLIRFCTGSGTKGWAVTGITATEWCEKQMQFVLLHGKRKVGKAMKTGSARHAKLEEEVVTRVKVDGKSIGDRWTLKLLNFMTGINQLLFEELTGFAESVWIVGVIDEIPMPATKTQSNPLLVDTESCQIYTSCQTTTKKWKEIRVMTAKSGFPANVKMLST